MHEIANKNDFIKSYRRLGVDEKTFDKYKFWFPVLPSPELARIVGDITSDGHLGSRIGLIMFISKNLLVLKIR